MEKVEKRVNTIVEEAEKASDLKRRIKLMKERGFSFANIAKTLGVSEGTLLNLIKSHSSDD